MFEKVFQALGRAGVQYVVVGGVAVVLQGYARMTLDIDLVVHLEDENLGRAIDALESAGLKPLLPVRARDFADENTRRDWTENRNMLVFTMRDDSVRPPLVVDIFAREPFPFDDFWRRANPVVIGDQEVRVASVADLVRMKQESGRAKDLDDIEKLTEIARKRNG
ncbi:MAG TPA: nucleotidyl transferase AbiEii/AbiGii toxin family protein [Thermoanaerobaculia bacterium]|jgi:predicted nucleotidyltransferase|nr:nucleotidyl transferase AbiEii/AbiGii toxin family protein [Thermoanaerobaculia bacterium]